MAVKALVDIFIAYRIVRILTTSWENQEAFKHGIIDRSGKVLKKSSTLKTPEEKSSYTLLHRLVFNLKRLVELAPFGKTKLGSYVSGLALLLKEDTEDGISLMDEVEIEYQQYISEEKLSKGTYKLKHDVLIGDGNKKKVAKKHEVVMLKVDSKPFENIFGSDVFKVIHLKSKKEILVSKEDLDPVTVGFFK